MLFNSIDFALFLPLVFILYWFILNKSIKIQNGFVLIASYVFYGWWDYRFLSLIFFSTIVDYFIGLKISCTKNSLHQKLFLSLSVIVNLGFLGFFKYYNFFIENFISAFSFIGISANFYTLQIILPVGISFYTFQTLSYTIDIYRNKMAPSKDFIAFAAFVSFFPQLVAGPIERATNLLPQFYKKRIFNYAQASIGMQQILWGLFKKIVIADNCAYFANIIFGSAEQYSGSTLLLGAIFFTFQIYGDFSGYSDIAIGVARLFGIRLMKNFAFPYFSRDIAEFWRRWHISLSTWFRDYLYIPLGGSKGNRLLKVRNVFIIFIVSGFWHGANWTFIIWGALNAIYFLPLLFTNSNRKNLGNLKTKSGFPNVKDFIKINITFGLTVIAWIFFRSENVSQAFFILSKIFSPSLFLLPVFQEEKKALFIMIMVFLFMLFEWHGREKDFAIECFGKNKSKLYRYSFYYVLITAILISSGEEQQFIYFQF